MDVKIEIPDLPRFQAALRRSPRIVSAHMQSAIEKSSYYFLSKTKENIRAGTEMWKPPIDTGYMWNNIFVDITPLRATLTAVASYAIYVHEGTRFMQARPFFTITENLERQSITKFFEDEMDSAMTEIVYGV